MQLKQAYSCVTLLIWFCIGKRSLILNVLAYFVKLVPKQNNYLFVHANQEVDNSVDVDNNGQFEPETEEAEECINETVQEDEDNNVDNDDDNDDDKSKKDKEQNDYYDNKEPAREEEDDDEMGNGNNCDSVDDETITINEQNDDDEAEQEKWYCKAKFMLDWINKFTRRHCVHPGIYFKG